jgi:putative restriction endonuclease
MPGRLSKAQLLDRVVSAVREAGAQVLFLSEEHSFDLVLQWGGRVYRVRVYIWNIGPGGRSYLGGSYAEEYRIQVTGVERPIAGPPGFQTLLLGWYEDLQVFVAFDASRHRNPSPESPSIQVSLSTMEDAAQRQGIGVGFRGGDEIVLAFPPELLMGYVSAQEQLHAFGDSAEQVRLLEVASAGGPLPGDDLEALPAERERVIRTVGQQRREASFRHRVLAAYHEACCMCGLQLELVEAAHIVPVMVSGSTDETCNGLALCAGHHLAYDRAVVGVEPDYQVIVNDQRINELSGLDLAGGETLLRAQLLPAIQIPDDPAERPRPEYLASGLALRGWAA